MVSPQAGWTPTITGGMVSLGPPEGEALVLAQLCDRAQQRAVATIIKAIIMVFLFIYSISTLDTFSMPLIFANDAMILSMSAVSCT